MKKQHTENSRYCPQAIHSRLAEGFYSPVKAAEFPEHILRFRNQRWALKVGLGNLSEKAWIDHFGRFLPLEGTLSEPLALKYHGHQFRSYNAEIGDGRGFLFAQLRDVDGRLLDLATKGSGRTPFSRFGDGRLTLKGAVREILATEMLEARGVYTSKSFSVIETGEALERQDEPSPTRSAVLVRLGHSHIRFGTFQYLSYHQDIEGLRRLIDHCRDFYFPDLDEETGDAARLAFFERVIVNSARLTAQWMAAGFVHGVLNSDNMNITGESFDYGPWRFLPHMDPGFTAAYFDQTKLYAYGRQPEAVGWNLAQLGGALLPAFDDTEKAETRLNEKLALFGPCFEREMAHAFANRFAVKSLDITIVGLLLRFLNESQLNLEQVLFDWFGGGISRGRAEKSPYKEYYRQSAWEEIMLALCKAEPVAPDRITRDYFLQDRPEDMRIETVEALWQPIAEQDDWQPFNQKIEAVRQAGQALGAFAQGGLTPP